MKQGLFANCYSTIHGLNLIKHVVTSGAGPRAVGTERGRWSE